MRRTLETVSGVATGATVAMHTATSLQIMGLKGEGICDDRTWIVKAHHPFLMPKSLVFTSHKVLCAVRNPLDVLPSYASLTNTLNHSAKPDWEWEKDYPEWWDWYIRGQTIEMKKYFELLINDCTTKGKNPIYFVRYEDLVSKKKDTLMGVFSFMLDVETLEGTNAERRIDQVIEMGSAATQTYKLKKTTGSFNTHLHRYTPEQLAFIQETLGEYLYFFGYAKHPEEENETSFFDFGEDQTHVDKHYGFQKVNQDSMNEVTSENRPTKEYRINEDGVWPLFDADTLAKMQDPARDYARKQLAEKAKARQN